MYRHRWLVILILVISLFSTTSACNKYSGNQNPANNVSVTNTTKVDTSNTNVDKNMNSTTKVSPTTSPDKGHGTSPVANREPKVDTVKEKIMGSDKKQLSDVDLEVNYKSIRINQNTKVDEITKKLGLPSDYEANNNGYISGNSKYRRWNLCYPSYSKPEIRIIILSERKYVGEEVKDGNSYIVGIFLEAYETQKGLKVGDKLEKVLHLYGKPESFENDILLYSKGSSHIEVTLNAAKENVDSLFIDYYMEKSVKEQESAN